jgi:hypothetical protein
MVSPGVGICSTFCLFDAHSISHTSSCARTDHNLLHEHPPHLSYSASTILCENVHRGDGGTRCEQGVWKPPLLVVPLCRFRLRVNDESQVDEGQESVSAATSCESGRSAATISRDGVSKKSFPVVLFRFQFRSACWGVVICIANQFELRKVIAE